MEMEEGKSIDSNPATGAAATSAVDVAAEAKEMKKLEKSIQKLAMDDNAKENSAKIEQISKLEVKRNELADEERRIRKAAWIADSRKEVLQLNKFRESKISDLFPELIWKRILSKLDDDSEKARLSNLNLVWRAALKMERAVFLFKDVFPLLHFGAYLDRNDILNCRAVCQEWNKLIENYIQNYFYYRPLSLLESRGIQPCRLLEIQDMEMRFRVEAPRVEAFMQWRNMQPPSNGNPIFSRQLRLGCICPHDNQMNYFFWGAAGRLLAQWGGEVWVLAIQCSRINYFNPVGIYEMARNVLQLVPNLKQFNIIAGNNQMEESAELMARMGANSTPFPDMTNLQILNLQHIPVGMLKAMLKKYQAQLKTVMINQDIMNWSDFAQIKFPKLEYFFAGLSRFLMDKPKLKLNWPSIQEISLQSEDVDPSGIPELFQSLDQVGGTLKKLSLTFQKPGKPSALDASVIRRLSLELPHLEEFSLTMDMGRANLKTIDFILPMSSLKELDLCYIKSISILSEPKKKGKKGGKGCQEGGQGSSTDNGTGTTSSAEIIQFWKYTKCMYDSNIWKLFPQLRKLTITSFIVNKMPEPLSVNVNVGPDSRPLDGCINRNQFKKAYYTRDGYKKQCADRQEQ